MNISLKYKNNNNTTSIKYGENGVPFISFNALEQTGIVINGFSTRLGGVSKKHLESMNLGYSRGDLEENVTENHRRMGEAIGFDFKRLVTTNQTHTTNVRVVDESDLGKGIITPRDYYDVDGLITNIRNIPLVTYYADCVPLYIVDVKNKAIGLSHSGWKGTVNKMAQVTLSKMNHHYGTKPEDVIACIGPSICQDCYEVSEDVADKVKEIFPNYTDEIMYIKPNGKYQLSLWEVNRRIFEEAGVLSEKLYTTDICTCCNRELLFSHRGLNGMRGNLGAFLMLK